MQLGRNALDYLLQDLEKKGQQMAVTLTEADPAALSLRLNRLREQAGISEAALYDQRGNVVAFSASTLAAMRPEPVPAAAIRRARMQQTTTSLDSLPEQGLVLRAIVPVNFADTEDPLRVLQLMHPVPKQLQEYADIVETGYRDYQARAYSLGALKSLYGITLTLTLLLALLSALGLAIVLSEKLSKPLGVLAEGTRAVAQGDFSRRHPVQSRDELGVLTDSFNRMTEQLAEGRERALHNQHAIETANAFLENLLRNLSAGVLAFDRDFRLRSANHSAAVILQQPMSELQGLTFDEWRDRQPALTAFAHIVHEGFAAAEGGQWQRQAELVVNRQSAHAADARHAHRRRQAGRLRRRLRRCVGVDAGAARRRVGGSRAQAGPRDQESADAHPAFGRTPAAQARGQAFRPTPKCSGAGRRPSSPRSMR